VASADVPIPDIAPSDPAMLRQILAFAPASVAPALLSFGFVYVFTRSLTPKATLTLVCATSAWAGTKRKRCSTNYRW
jgi:hypothetical protein